MPLPARLCPSGLNSRLIDDNLSFLDYVSKMRGIITKARFDLTEPNRDTILNANAPYEWRPSTATAKGVLLIHGLFDSPYFLQNIAKHFLAQGYLVRGVLLPGHGTVPGDLLEVTYEEWLKTVRYGIQSFQDEVEELHLVGFSTGGILASCAYLEKSYPFIKSIFTLSPAIELSYQFVFRLQQYTHWNNLLSKFCKACQFFHIAEDNDYTKYQSFAFNGAYQVFLLTKYLSKLVKEKNPIEIPQFLVMSKDDEIIDYKKVIQFFNSEPHSLSKMLLYSAKKEAMTDKRIEIINSCFPEKNIVDFSHICIPFPADDPRYGINGSFEEFTSILKKTEKIVKKKNIITQSSVNDAGKDANQIHYGALAIKNLKTYPMRRLSYNPLYDQMIEKMDEFLEAIGE